MNNALAIDINCIAKHLEEIKDDVSYLTNIEDDLDNINITLGELTASIQYLTDEISKLKEKQ